MTTQPEFIEFPKMGRLSRTAVITEKIDGTNAQIMITEDGDMFVGSRTKWITPENDNYGFARWAVGNRSTLMDLGPGRHFGEWWGNGIQRNYGLKEKRFSLFNVIRWALYGTEPGRIPSENPTVVKMQELLPEGIGLVPVIQWVPQFNVADVDTALARLAENGSFAAPGFMKPEGVVVYHLAGNVGFKKTLEGDEPKWMAKQ